MQVILSVDASQEPARFELVGVEGRQVEILEQREVPLGDLFHPVESPEHEVSSEQDQTEGDTDQEASAEPADPEPDSEESDGTESEVSVTGASDIIAQTIRSFEQEWTNPVLIIPAHQSASLTLHLPFTDPKRIETIIDMEVQDRVPFDVSEFLIQPTSVTATENGEFEIHVSMIPKSYVRKVLQICRKNNFEPYIISTPSGVLGAAYYLAPEYLAENSALLLQQNGTCHCVLSIDGIVRADRIITSLGGKEADESNALLSELKRTVAATEDRYDTKLDTIYSVHTKLDKSTLQQQLGRNVEELEVKELVKSGNTEKSLASLGAVFAQDNLAPVPLTNFRTREFAYRLQLGDLFEGLRQLAPYMIATFLFLLAWLGSTYFIRDLRIQRTRSAMRSEINQSIPTLSIPSGKEITMLQAALIGLEREVEVIAAATKYPPLDSFAELSKIKPHSNEIEFKKIEIKNNKIVVGVVAPSHADIARYRNTLRNSEAFCKVDDEAGPGSGRKIAKTLTLELCERG